MRLVPPGGQRWPRAPDVLKVPSSTLVSTALVDDVSFWRAPGQPQAVLAWEQAHLPRRFTPEDADFGPPTWDRTFSLAPIPGVLNARDLVVEVAGAGHGQTAIRVDAQVSWQPPRPTAERVPSAARVVTITQPPSPDPHAGRPPAPVTITDLAAVCGAVAGAPVRAGSTIFRPQWSPALCLARVGRSRRASRGLACDPFACSHPRGVSMALYMYQASYTAKSMAAQLTEPRDPVAAIRPVLEDLGATMLVAGFPFGEYDVLVVYDAPDDMTAASVAMAVAAEGEVKSAKTTRLLSGQEWLESLRKRRIVNTRKAH